MKTTPSSWLLRPYSIDIGDLWLESQLFPIVRDKADVVTVKEIIADTDNKRVAEYLYSKTFGIPNPRVFRITTLPELIGGGIYEVVNRYMKPKEFFLSPIWDYIQFMYKTVRYGRGSHLVFRPNTFWCAYGCALFSLVLYTGEMK